MSESRTSPAQVDGRSARAFDLVPLAFAGFAHFTAMQVRDGATRGFDLHLARLRAGSETLFGRTLSDDRIRGQIRSATAGAPRACSVVATMFSHTGEFTPSGSADDPGLFVRVAPPSDGPAGPLRLFAVPHERWLPAIKHVGEGAKTFHLREAVKRGYDDAVFIDHAGSLSEATIWNLAFWDGGTVVWPEARMLPGITMSILRRRLEALHIAQRTAPVTLASLRDLTGAVVMNSWTPAVAVARIGDTDFARSDILAGILHRAYATEVMTAI